MLDFDDQAERESVEREEESVQRQRSAAAKADSLGPGTAGHTISGAAYRGMEVAAHTGAPSPAERGFANDRRGKLDDAGPA